jgi:hypothetical protein
MQRIAAKAPTMISKSLMVTPPNVAVLLSYKLLSLCFISSRDERVAVNIAKLPELLGQGLRGWLAMLPSAKIAPETRPRAFERTSAAVIELRSGGRGGHRAAAGCAGTPARRWRFDLRRPGPLGRRPWLGLLGPGRSDPLRPGYFHLGRELSRGV